MPDRRDKFYYLAKKERYRSRAAFKLLELQTKYGFLKEGQNILEIGSSPGGWSQIVTSITGSTVFSVDIDKMDPLENNVFIRGRVGDKALKVRIKDEMDKLGIEAFDGILSDAMSKTSGNQDIDHSSSYLICQEVMALAETLLKPDGFVLVKQFQGDLTVKFVNQWKKYFGFSKITKVAASREGSKEIYIIFQYLKGF
ncbi:MAG: RlmE family RNA methyltransferase [Candidatus Thermoplasmatota archaeon]|nr:RlmE family RNA methyltransferase [Candidatus Thermoplasmatota archaeon]MCL5955529.1 RlmE family RNA methyltransferase [Candidatus Thermoplasmatota archaeon]